MGTVESYVKLVPPTKKETFSRSPHTLHGTRVRMQLSTCVFMQLVNLAPRVKYGVACADVYAKVGKSIGVVRLLMFGMQRRAA